MKNKKRTTPHTNQKKITQSELTPQQDLFVHYYARLKNATQAALKAGYSPKTAGTQGSDLLSRLQIRLAVRDAIDKQLKKIELTPDWIAGEMLKLANVDIRDAFDEEGNLKPLNELSESVAKAIASIEIEALYEGRGSEREQVGTVKKVRFWSKDRALEMLAKYQKMFADLNIDLRGGKLVFQDIKVDKTTPTEDILKNINNRLIAQHSKE